MIKRIILTACTNIVLDKNNNQYREKSNRAVFCGTPKLKKISSSNQDFWCQGNILGPEEGRLSVSSDRCRVFFI